MNTMYECNLPPYLAHDLEAWKKGVEEHSHVNQCTVFVSSSDAYADLWPAFFAIFKREWPTFSGRIYLNTEQKTFKYDGLDIICTRVGRQRHFGETLRAGLDCVRESNAILFFMIDYFFEGKVDVEKLDLLYHRFHEDSVDVLFLYPHTPKIEIWSHSDMTNPDCTVLVYSCDKYADLLAPFAALWRHYADANVETAMQMANTALPFA